MTRVLLVDDAPDIRFIAKLSLQLEGLEVHLAENGREGLEVAAAVDPDLIVLDVMMPELDGPGTLLALRAAGYDGPVVFLTASVQRDEVRGYLALGADGVLAKPFDPTALAGQLKEIHDRVRGGG